MGGDSLHITTDVESAATNTKWFISCGNIGAIGGVEVDLCEASAIVKSTITY